MTVIHIVLFKFRADVDVAHKEKFVKELKSLKNLSCVHNRQLFVGGPSITTPIEKSKGFEYSLVSFHPDPEALAAYQASEEHERVTSTYLWPYKEDVTRFDFEIQEEDQGILQKIAKSILGGL